MQKALLAFLSVQKGRSAKLHGDDRTRQSGVAATEDLAHSARAWQYNVKQLRRSCTSLQAKTLVGHSRPSGGFPLTITKGAI